MRSLVARQSGAPAPHHEPKAVVQEGRQSGDTECVGAPGGNLDGQSDAIQSTTKVDDDRRVGVRQFEPVEARGSALDKELDRGERERFGGRNAT